MELNRKDRQILISSFVNDHSDLTLYQCFKELEKFGIAKSTVYSVGQKVRSNSVLNNYANCGRKAIKMTNRKLDRFAVVAEGWTSSQRKLAAKFNISLTYCRLLLKKFNIKTWKKRDAPKSTPGQQERQRQRLKILSENLMPVTGKKDIIEDDESYFSLSGKINKFFLSSNPAQLEPNITLKQRSKFEKRLCVWIAISKKGASEPFFVPANCAVNAEIYSKECIEARLIPFIQKNHSNNRYIFWPDGASSHYAAVTMATISKFGIKIVKKTENPPNVPQLRSIERFWSHLKAKVYENGWEANDFLQLRRRILQKIGDFDSDYFSRLFRYEKARISAAAENGPLSVIYDQNYKN